MGADQDEIEHCDTPTQRKNQMYRYLQYMSSPSTPQEIPDRPTSHEKFVLHRPGNNSNPCRVPLPLVDRTCYALALGGSPLTLRGAVPQMQSQSRRSRD